MPGSGGTQCPVLHAGTPPLHSRKIVNQKYIQTQSQAPGVARQTNIHMGSDCRKSGCGGPGEVPGSTRGVSGDPLVSLDASEFR